MTDPIFAIPRTDYGSYVDLYRLIELSGFSTVYMDEIDAASDNTYIITVRNGELAGGFPNARARIVLWDLEYRREPQAPIPGVPEVWHMDVSQAKLIGAKYVPVGGHEGLREGSDTPSSDDYDVAYLAYMTYRREHVRNQLMARGLRVSPGGAWGDERHRILCGSRVYLHVHQHDDIPAVPGLRMVVAAAYSLPVISEAFTDEGIFKDHGMFGVNYMLSSLYAEIASCAYEWTAGYYDNSGPLNNFGAALHRLLCHEYTFRLGVEAAL